MLSRRKRVSSELFSSVTVRGELSSSSTAVEGRIGKLGGAEVGLLAVEGRVEFLTERSPCQLADVEQEKEGQILAVLVIVTGHLRTRHRFQASSVHQNLHGQLLLPVQAHSVPLQQSTT